MSFAGSCTDDLLLVLWNQDGSALIRMKRMTMMKVNFDRAWYWCQDVDGIGVDEDHDDHDVEDDGDGEEPGASDGEHSLLVASLPSLPGQLALKMMMLRMLRMMMMKMLGMMLRMIMNYSSVTNHSAKCLEAQFDLQWFCDDEDDLDKDEEDDNAADKKTWRLPFKQGDSCTLPAYESLAPACIGLLLIVRVLHYCRGWRHHLKKTPLANVP